MRYALLCLCIAAALSPAARAEDKAAPSSAARCPAALPPPVVARQQAILAAARARDYAGLRKQVTKPQRFTSSFGEATDPLVEWNKIRQRGIDLAAIMAAIFAMPCTIDTVEGTTIYTWPSAADLEWAALNAEERTALQKLYGTELDTYWLEGRDKGYYVGWRGTIEADGTWTVFVVGD